jgi:hypothetical protein
VKHGNLPPCCDTLFSLETADTCQFSTIPNRVYGRRYLRHIMVSLWPRRLRDKLFPEPLPPLGSFAGKTVLVTGASGGLGLAAATHFASFGATVILTSRTVSQGSSAKDYVEQSADVVGKGKVHAMELDMSQYSSCVSFIEQLKKCEATRFGLDVAVLNAGLINIDFVRSPEGWYVVPHVPSCFCQYSTPW